MQKSKKINKHKNKTQKIKKYINSKKFKKGGFSFSDITNWKPDFTSWKSNLTENFRNFSNFEGRNDEFKV